MWLAVQPSHGDGAVHFSDGTASTTALKPAMARRYFSEFSLMAGNVAPPASFRVSGPYGAADPKRRCWSPRATSATRAHAPSSASTRTTIHPLRLPRSKEFAPFVDVE